MEPNLKVKLKVPTDASVFATKRSNTSKDKLVGACASVHTDELLLGAPGASKLKELLSTAPNPEEAIHSFQHNYGIPALSTSSQLCLRRKDNGYETLDREDKAQAVADKKSLYQRQHLLPGIELLSLLHMWPSQTYRLLLDELIGELQVRIAQLNASQLQQLLERTFAYIEFRELRSIVMNILQRQSHTPEKFLLQLTENRKIYNEVPLTVRRRIMQVCDKEWKDFVHECTATYVLEYVQLLEKCTVDASDGVQFWVHTFDENRKKSSALVKLIEMIGDSEVLYLKLLETLKEYIEIGKIPGTENKIQQSKGYASFIGILGALRFDLSYMQRDKTSTLLRSDPLHRVMWLLDRLARHPAENPEPYIAELMAFLQRLRIGDVRPIKKSRKHGAPLVDEDEIFEIMYGPPDPKLLIELVEKLAKIDHHLIFAQPVPEDVPNYHETIDYPMDLKTMREKALAGEYESAEAFTGDFEKMITNCLTYNLESTIYYKEGKRVGKRGAELMDRQGHLLRGQPQSLACKKRKKASSAGMQPFRKSSLVLSSSSSNSCETLLAIEGSYNEVLGDVAILLCDPRFNQTICNALILQLLESVRQAQLPTDMLLCKCLVQLLQIGYAATIRRQIRKKDHQLRAPHAITMRVFLPLLARIIIKYRMDTPTLVAAHEANSKTKISKGEELDSKLWDNLLRSNASIRALAKSFVLFSLSKNQIVVAASILQYIANVDQFELYQDQAYAYELRLAVQSEILAAAFREQSGDRESTASRHDITDLSLWKCIVDEFFMRIIRNHLTHAVHEAETAVVSKMKDEEDSSDDLAKLHADIFVKSFPLHFFFEQVVLLLVSIFAPDNASSGVWDTQIVLRYLREILSPLQSTSSIPFHKLWESARFQACRQALSNVCRLYPSIEKALWGGSNQLPVIEGNGDTKSNDAMDSELNRVDCAQNYCEMKE